MLSRDQIRRNRRDSQAVMRQEMGPPRSGYNYDECPPACSLQGGAGAYVEEVLADPNQTLGRRLAVFFAANRVERGQWYKVKFRP